MFTHVRNAVSPWMLAAASVCLLWTSVANADATKDREYLMGDDSFENPAVGIAPTSDFGAFTLDSSLQGVAMDQGFHDLNPAGGGPLYVDADATGGLNRPGAAATEWALGFDGVDDHLFIDGAINVSGGLGIPEQAFGQTLYGGSVNYDNITNRIIDLWVRPTAAAAGRQDIVSDTDQFTVYISAPVGPDRFWALTHGDPNANNQEKTISAVPVVLNAWTHVMHRSITQGTGVLYVNGLVAAVETQDADGTPEVANNFNFVIGAGVNKTTNFFTGQIDNVVLSIAGDNTTDPGPPVGQNWGTVDLAVDNDFIRQALIGKPLGDVNLDGFTNPADVTVFISNWLKEQEFNNVQLGDLTSRAQGDFDFDGDIDLADAFVLRDGLVPGGFGASFSLGSLVPEPGSVVLAVWGLVALVGVRRRRS